MTVMINAKILKRARELNDRYPEGICPGCHGTIIGWHEHHSHRPATNLADHVIWRDNNVGEPCVWDRDMLSARSYRRRLIRELS